MHIFFTILDGLRYIAGIAISLYVIIVIYGLFHLKKKSVSWRELTPGAYLNSLFGEDSILKVPFIVIIAIGVVWGLCSIFLANTVIGSPFEKDNYTEAYEAAISFNDHSLFCIAHLERSTEDGESRYRIYSISLPYGKEIDTDASYSPKVDENYVDISMDATGSLYQSLQSCQISLDSPATSSSYKLLQSTVLSSSGELCASRESDMYHTLDCQYAQQIAPEDFIYFDSYEVAEYFGYSCHDGCFVP